MENNFVMLESSIIDKDRSLVAFKNRINKCDVLLLPDDYRKHRSCVSDKGMAQALGKEIWQASRLNR